MSLPARPPAAWLAQLPGALRAGVEHAWEHFVAADVGANAERFATHGAAICRLFAASPFAADLCVQEPGWLAAVLRAPDRPLPTAGVLRAQFAAALGATADEAALMRLLRRTRRAVQLELIWRDVHDLAPIDGLLAAQSALADASVQAALAWLGAQAVARHGQPRDAQGQRQELLVVALGKLGGQELNFSSDIDLMFVYPAEGETDGPRPLANGEYFTRLARRLMKVLSEVTADGFAFRTDARLRPFGASGPLAVNLTGLEYYYHQHGREWERYALVKARCLTGAPAAREALQEILRPFVYRRYLDYGAIEALRGIKQLIEQEVARAERQDDIKLGPGGIREIEFIAQLFQLIRGGREPALQQHRLLPTLARLAALELIPPAQADALAAAYRFLRRVENRLQQVADRQTHELPTAARERARLAFGLGCEGWEALDARLAAHRGRVREEFDAVFRERERSPAEPGASTDAHAAPGEQLAALWLRGVPTEAMQAALRELALAEPGLIERLRRLRESSLYTRMSETARRRLDALVAPLLLAASRTEQPLAAAERLLQVVEAIGQRSTYLALLLESPGTLMQLARLCAASGWIAEQIAAHPLLLDELLDPQTLQAPPTAAQMADEAARLAAACPELETFMERLRQFQQSQSLRIAAADVAGALPLMRVSDRLTALAEVVLAQVLTRAWQDLAARHGTPWCGSGPARRPAHFAVIGYGKLGGLELGYGSDLDLVFLHDSAGEAQQTDGERSLENSVFFGRLAQRILHLLHARMPAGVLYEVDTRLRPSGRAGLLVSSLESFERYQQEQAWTWEHQALVRARPVAGAEALAGAFAALRGRVLGRLRDPRQLRQDVLEMRERMRGELDRSTEEAFDLKQGGGGIVDIEFMVQYLVLRWAPERPALLQVTDNIRLLEAFAAQGLAAEDAAVLADGYRELRAHVHRCSLQGVPARVPPAAVAPVRERVQAVWRHLFTA
ncbi:MAG TPA: bifunctional [glutamate--ammonia ligase]-adenylyl-L-tyrosine phosphorylase/[glutamate--ammonia-ligase] adenylyltransferase [Gammaproteobacteria bacterium]|nr:bifunctional [glutamate--ammonia ligase]-adenylyl-L-tyrosine phosphorylase/[glutamate--ammonia-ligase] adenylyltransferase [Gammaproteobacteria bacterium]